MRDLEVVIPSSLDQAKTFLSNQSVRLPPRFPRVRFDPLQTSLSARSDKEEMICHGCHSQMGGGAHNGSAPGKNLCTFLHSSTCAGGIMEDADWKGCPNDYIPGLISASGFEQTLQQTDFGPPHSSTRLQGIPQPSFSTPQLAGQIITEHSLETPHPGFNQNPNPQTFPRQSELQPDSTPMSAPHQSPTTKVIAAFYTKCHSRPISRVIWNGHRD